MPTESRSFFSIHIEELCDRCFSSFPRPCDVFGEFVISTSQVGVDPPFLLFRDVRRVF